MTAAKTAKMTERYSRQLIALSVGRELGPEPSFERAEKVSCTYERSEIPIDARKTAYRIDS